MRTQKNYSGGITKQSRNMKKKKGILKRYDRLISDLGDALDDITLPENELVALNVAEQIDMLKRARYLYKIYKP